MNATSYFTEHAGHALLPIHRHGTAYASLVLSGEHWEHSLDGAVCCEPGTLIVHPPYHAHGNRFARRATRVVNVVLHNVAIGAGLLLRRVEDRADALRLFESGSHHLAALLDAAPMHPLALPPDWQQAYLRALAEDNLALGVIARRVGVSAAHASRSMMRSFGMSPQQLRRELRWRAALALLRGDTSLGEVAARAGFADQSHFSRLARAFTGLSPAALRRQIKCVQDRRDAVRRE